MSSEELQNAYSLSGIVRCVTQTTGHVGYMCKQEMNTKFG